MHLLLVWCSASSPRPCYFPASVEAMRRHCYSVLVHEWLSLLSFNTHTHKHIYITEVLGRLTTSCELLLFESFAEGATDSNSLFHQTEPCPSMIPSPLIVIPLSFVNSSHCRTGSPSLWVCWSYNFTIQLKQIRETSLSSNYLKRFFSHFEKLEMVWNSPEIQCLVGK